jgi:hypothetical protein
MGETLSNSEAAAGSTTQLVKELNAAQEMAVIKINAGLHTASPSKAHTYFRK